jgi:large subunit ribosomal protein L31e
MADEKTFNVPLRKGYMKAPKHKRAKKAVSTLRAFLQRHMKTSQIKLGPKLNEKLWEKGIKNPPHHVKVTAVKEEDTVKAELFGHKYVEKKKEEKEEGLTDKLAKKLGRGKRRTERKAAEEAKEKETKEEKADEKQPVMGPEKKEETKPETAVKKQKKEAKESKKEAKPEPKKQPHEKQKAHASTNQEKKTASTASAKK